MAKVETPTVDALSRAHTSLQKDLRELEEAGHTASEKGLPGLRSRLKSTRKHIAEHFRFEEQGGYMDAVRKREPRLGRVIDELCTEHGQLLSSLDAILKETATASSMNDLMRGELTGWINRVRQHEARENQVVQDAFNLDIGSED